MPQAQKDAISRGLKEYYKTHNGPWKGKKKSKELRDSISRSLKKYWKSRKTEVIA
jgi:hypothetical protein